VKPNISMNYYTKEGYNSDESEKEYEFMNNSNFGNINDDKDGSSIFSDNTIEKENERLNTFQSTDFDYKLKTDFDTDEKYNIFGTNHK